MPSATAQPSLDLRATITAFANGRAEERLVAIDSRPVSRTDVRLRYKSTDRGPYDEARARVDAGGPSGVFDALLYNEEREVTECAIANIAVEMGNGVWVTPPTECGLLGGTLRAALLRSGQLVERVVPIDLIERLAAMDTRRGSEGEGPSARVRLVAFNSVRGIYPVRVVRAGARATPLSRL